MIETAGGRAPLRVCASASVAALVGREQLGRLRSEVSRRYNCWVCGQPGRTDAHPASVIALRYRVGAISVRLAHLRCADSQVIETARDTVDAAGLGAMLSKAAVLEYASEPRVRPLLILEPKIAVSDRSPGDDSVSLWTADLQQRGFTPLRTSGQLPRVAEGWLLQVAPGAARLLAPDGSPAYEGALDPPRAWLYFVLNASMCVILTGTIGLSTRLEDETGTRSLRALLHQAASSAGLIGAVVRAQECQTLA